MSDFVSFRLPDITHFIKNIVKINDRVSG